MKEGWTLTIWDNTWGSDMLANSVSDTRMGNSSMAEPASTTQRATPAPLINALVLMYASMQSPASRSSCGILASRMTPDLAKLHAISLCNIS